MYIERTLEKEVNKYLSTREIIAIIGARQCGKTTLIKHIFEGLDNALFLDFEDRETLELFETDIKTFARLYAQNYDYLFIDEFQYAKEGGKNLKFIYDHYDTKIIITGSSSSDLSITSIQYLVGRIFVFQLNPLSFQEFLNFKDSSLSAELHSPSPHANPVIRKINQHLNEFLIFGGYPRVVITDDIEEKKLVLKNIYNTYFLKEIKQILNLPSDYKLSKLINVLALQIGGILNYNELSTITGFKYHDLKEHLNILQKTFITIESKPFFTNKRTELVKSPKIYFLDNGFRNVVLKNFQEIARRTDAGNLCENFVASELMKKGYDLRYWRTKSKAEIDFVIEKEGNLVPLEVKSGADRTVFPRSLWSFIEKYKPKAGYITTGEVFASRKINATEIRWIPLYYPGTVIEDKG